MAAFVTRIQARTARMPDLPRALAGLLLGIVFAVAWTIGTILRLIWAVVVWLAAAAAQGYTEGFRPKG